MNTHTHLIETLTARAETLDGFAAEFTAWAADSSPRVAWGWSQAAHNARADARECRALVAELTPAPSTALARRPITWAPTVAERQARTLAAALRSWEDGLASMRPALCLGVSGHVAPHAIRNDDYCCGDWDAEGWCRSCCDCNR
jgi:hypothetical protein